jgi:glycosyltransferase involved in cell wall biosynthesis
MRIAFIDAEGYEGRNLSYETRLGTLASQLRKMGHSVYYGSQATQFDHTMYDVFVFSGVYERSLAEYLLFLQSHGKTVVYDMDQNFEAMEPSRYREMGILSSREMITAADIVTVSTQAIKEVAERTDNEASVHLVRNGVECGEMMNGDAPDKVRIAIQGAHQIDDLDIVSSAIAQIQKDFDAEVVLYGFGEVKSDQIPHISDTGVVYEHKPMVSYSKFKKELLEDGICVGIIPMSDSIENSAKTCQRMYDFVSCGIPVLASNVGEYAHELPPHSTVKNRHKKWYTAIRAIISDNDLRKDRYTEQYTHMCNNRNIENIAKDFVKIIK